MSEQFPQPPLAATGNFESVLHSSAAIPVPIGTTTAAEAPTFASAAPPPKESDRIPPSAPAASSRNTTGNMRDATGRRRVRRWPWMLLAGSLGLVLGCALGIGGTLFATGSSYKQSIFVSPTTPEEDGSAVVPDQHPYGWSYPYGHDFLDDGSSAGSNSQDITLMRFTYDEIVNALPDAPSTIELNQNTGVISCTAGAYQVGTLSGIPAGTYFLEGSNTEESRYVLFKAVSGRADPRKTEYAYHSQNTYIGSYFLSLSDGDLLVYLPANGEGVMCDEASAEVAVGEPLTSGLYRVGVDIPEGTYRVRVDADLTDSVSLEPGAYVMSERSFLDGTVVDERFVTIGSNQTVSVRDGDWLELYGATATLE